MPRISVVVLNWGNCARMGHLATSGDIFWVSQVEEAIYLSSG